MQRALTQYGGGEDSGIWPARPVTEFTSALLISAHKKEGGWPLTEVSFHPESILNNPGQWHRLFWRAGCAALPVRLPAPRVTNAALLLPPPTGTRLCTAITCTS